MCKISNFPRNYSDGFPSKNIRFSVIIRKNRTKKFVTLFILTKFAIDNHTEPFYVMSRRIICLIIYFTVAVCRLHSNVYTTDRTICSADGLSNDFITRLAIDGYGYIWTASEAGVNRISGTSCQTFLITNWPPEGNFMYLTDNVKRLPGQMSRDIFRLKTTALKWHQPTKKMFIGTEFGIIVYDPLMNTVRFLTFKDGLELDGIEDIIDANSGVWIIFSGGKVQQMDCQTLRTTTIKQKYIYHTACGAYDNAGRIYIGHSRDGLTVIDTKTKQERHFRHEPNNPNSLPGNNVRRILRDQNNRIWVGTDGGLALFHPVSGTFTIVEGKQHDNVYDICQMHDGTIWIATDQRGIRVLNPELIDTHGTLTYDDTEIQSSSVSTRAVTQDIYGNVWIGNHGTGVDFISSRKAEFSVFHDGLKNHAIYSTTRGNNGMLWTAGADGLSLWKDNSIADTWKIVSSGRGSSTYTRCMIQTHDGTVWLGIDDCGVMRFNPQTRRFTGLPLPGGFMRDIHSLSEDSNGRIWIGSELGVYSYAEGEGVRREEIINKVTGNAIVTSFLWIKNDKLLLTTYGLGAFVIDMNSGKSVSLTIADSIPSQRINKAVSDGKGGLWLATHMGLVHVDNALKLRGIKVYSAAQGLADNYICAIATDENGRVWMSTFSGVSCLDSKTERIYNYDYLDFKEACGFYPNGIANTENGIYLCSTAGLVHFNPMTVGQNEHISDVQISACEAYSPDGTNTKIISLSPDDDGIYRTDYKQNTIRIAFCVSNQAQCPHVEYSYLMKGMDDKWYYISDDYDVVFRGLPPGKYTFCLRAKLKSQDWTDATCCEIKIEIKPPLWQTWWAYTLYALTLAMITWLIVRTYKSRLKLRNRLELKQKESLQQQQANEERLHFFTNITHELRTPLTLILGPLDDLIDDKRIPNDSKQRVGIIKKNAETLHGLINELLEFRKTETHNRRLSVARSNIGLFIEEICMNFKALYNNPQVDFSYYISDNLPCIYFDSEVITTIFNNLLSNAMKYTERGRITVSVHHDEISHKIVIEVKDTGYGISQKDLPHVFDRYYQASNTHQASGTGIGLALVKSLAELHKADILAESTEGQGSTFTLRLNIDETYTEALHKEDNDSTLPSTLHDANTRTMKRQNEIPEDETKMSLLVVEDNADIREYIASSFEEDFTILQAENGEEGLRLALNHIPDIIVSDIMMPRMDGTAMTKVLKDDIRTSHIPVIMLTAKVTDNDKEEGYLCGADSYLTKPFTTKLLAARIKNLLTARRRLAEHIINSSVTGTQASDNSLTKQEVPQLSPLDKRFPEQLNNIIEDNIRQEELNLAFITDKMAMSHSTFYRKVKALTGLTAKEYIRKFRLRYSRQLIESGEYNVSEAAMMAGFNHMAHFRQTFKNEFGLLPSEVARRR